MNPKHFLPLAAATIGISSVSAQQDPIEVDPMVVTASRIEEPASQALAAVSVISAEDIRQSVAEDLLELLRLQAGVDVVRSGPAGAQTSVFLRGTNSNHTLVLIDGVRVSSANNGAYAWENLPLNQIQRVEIVRGPRASVYGSDAIGGVIQIFTRKDTSPSLRVTSGHYDSREIAASWGLANNHSRFNASAAYRDSDGFSAQNPQGFAYDPDDDGFSSRNLLLNGANALAGGEFSYSLLLLDNDADFDQGRSTAKQQLATLAYHGSLSPQWKHQLQLGWNQDQLDTASSFSASAFDSQRIDAGWHHQFLLNPAADLLFGIDYYSESAEAGGSYDQDRRNSGAYAAIKGQRSNHAYELSGRLDDNSEFGSEFTGQAAWAWKFHSHWRLLASYGTGFRAANASEQFSPGFGGLFAGNPALEPESSRSLELGLGWTPSATQRVMLNLYRTRIKDLISFSGANFQAININRANIEGLELTWDHRGVSWDLGAALTLQQAEDGSTGSPLLRRPDEKLALSANRKLNNGGWLGAEWFYSSERRDFAGPLQDYQILNLRAGYPVSSRWQLEARLENAFDQDYQPALGFNGMGRAAFFSLSWLP